MKRKDIGTVHAYPEGGKYMAVTCTADVPVGANIYVEWDEPLEHHCDRLSRHVAITKTDEWRLDIIDRPGSPITPVVQYCPGCGARLP
jgi:hypothetical protein